MTQTGYSNAIVNALLGWLKGLASWVLKLFDLAGSGGSPLLWLSEHWLQLLIFLLILGASSSTTSAFSTRTTFAMPSAPMGTTPSSAAIPCPARW